MPLLQSLLKNIVVVVTDNAPSSKFAKEHCCSQVTDIAPPLKFAKNTVIVR